jgi:hypothetical protein
MFDTVQQQACLLDICSEPHFYRRMLQAYLQEADTATFCPESLFQKSSLSAAVAALAPAPLPAPPPAGGHDPSWRGLKAVELYDPVQDCWRAGPMLPSALPFAGAGVPTRGQVYIIGGGGCCQAVSFSACSCGLFVYC